MDNVVSSASIPISDSVLAIYCTGNSELVTEEPVGITDLSLLYIPFKFLPPLHSMGTLTSFQCNLMKPTVYAIQTEWNWPRQYCALNQIAVIAN
ncbi:unnamed protein product [Pieris brassicae]|uniref:Uncharacterized protein n=1 Tax=Pieris brassicae TaxID=7116 RepID=A0A9P0XJ72_PIEBR|nr:unnamed protein product [Pieris brassicae]